MRRLLSLALATVCISLALSACSGGDETGQSGKPAVAVDNAELTQLFEQDQADRQGGEVDWSTVIDNDRNRRARVEQLLMSDSVVTAGDCYHAAMVFQHGGDTLSYRRAYDLACRSVALDSTNEDALWLTAASYDRYLLSKGEPQWYGTQLLILNGVTYLQKIDTTRVTDADRVRLGVETLDQIHANLTAANGDDRGLLQVPDSVKVKVLQ